MKTNYLLLLAAGMLAAAGCTSQSAKTGVATRLVHPIVVAPSGLPTTGISHFRFPEDSATISGWVQRHDSVAISEHGWGLWTALTSPLPRPDSLPVGDTLRVFQTWKTKQELINDQLEASPASAAGLTARQGLAMRPRPLLGGLERPRQLLHSFHRQQLPTSAADTLANPVADVVRYDPVAAQTILQGQLFQGATLRRMLHQQRRSIPRFPARAVVIKPMYVVIPGPDRATAPFPLKVWANIPDSLTTHPSAYGLKSWNTRVYVDVHNKGQGAGQAARPGQAASPAHTYNVRDFVYYTLSQAEANALDSANVKTGARAGDIAILVGMHITTSETRLWTWQTYWWTPDPARVPAPSSANVVAHRPAQLRGAPRHYAMSIGYQMLDPAPPLSRGTNRGRSVYVYNPYLEAPFGPGDFDQKAVVITDNMLVANNVGMRSNCMSCHAQANYPNAKGGPGYLGDTYVDYNAPAFKGVLKTDFLWSIPNAASQLAIDSARRARSAARAAGGRRAPATPVAAR